MTDSSIDPAADLLRANRAFYRAFAAGDFVAMDRAWAETPGVLCLHPGWNMLHGRDQVMASWHAILRRPLPVKTRAEVAEIIGEVGVVVCVEMLRDVELAATNVFVREDGRWRLMHHQAGLIARRDEDEDEDEDGDDEDGSDYGGGRLLN